MPKLQKLLSDSTNLTEINKISCPDLNFSMSKYCFDQFANNINKQLKQKYDENPKRYKDMTKTKILMCLYDELLSIQKPQK